MTEAQAIIDGSIAGLWPRLLGLIVFAALGLAVFVLGLPGRIAIARNHPEADAVNLMGWVGFVAIVPWIQALIWAFKPTDVIDIRNMPEAEQRETQEMIARLKGKVRGRAAALEPDPPIVLGDKPS